MKLLANTPVGIFERTTNTTYQYVVVRTSPRAKEAYCLYHNNNYRSSFATDKRWVKDHGFAVTWHGSKQSADKSALGSYSWDKSATLVGVYEVQQ
jgi:hypothetical protein